MQKVLVLKNENKTIISKPWCFEALCLINDSDITGDVSLKIYMNVMMYLFEGTEATDEIILKLPVQELRKMAQKLNSWYMEDMISLLKIKDEIPKKENNSAGGCLRDIYNSIFKAWGTMPSEVAKQPPVFIFNLLKGEGSNVTKESLPEDLKALYGM